MNQRFKMSTATKYLANALALPLVLNIMAVLSTSLDSKEPLNCLQLFVITQEFKLWGQIIICISGLIVYGLFLFIQKLGKWNVNHMRIIYFTCTVIFIGFLLVAFSDQIKDAFLLKYDPMVTSTPCATFKTVLETKSIIPNTLIRLLHNPMLWFSILSLIFIADFMKYAYGIKKENESFI